MEPQNVGPRQTSAPTDLEALLLRRRRGRRLRPESDGPGTELNIVPYLDIMVNLIMFLLVTQATMVALGIVNVGAPAYADPTAPAPTDASEPASNLRLTVGVGTGGFYVDAAGAEPAAGVGSPPTTQAGPTIPLVDGLYDYPALGRHLRRLKGEFPESDALFLAADAGVAYHVIVRTLDATREDAAGLLFPAVAFSRLD